MPFHDLCIKNSCNGRIRLVKTRGAGQGKSLAQTTFSADLGRFQVVFWCPVGLGEVRDSRAVT